ncbi:hypothetical protein R3I94_001331 [Phoxinus phoxinus]
MCNRTLAIDGLWSDSPPSFQEDNLVGSDIDYEPVPCSSRPRRSRREGALRGRGRQGRGRGARASTSRERGEGGRGRGRGRGQARGRGSLLADLSQDDFKRVEELHKQRMQLSRYVYIDDS